MPPPIPYASISQTDGALSAQPGDAVHAKAGVCSAGPLNTSTLVATKTALTSTFGRGPLVEVHVHAPMETLLERDTKGLYAKALAGEVKHFTGVDDPYEAPATPDLSLDTSTLDTATCTTRILEVLARYGVVP